MWEPEINKLLQRLMEKEVEKRVSDRIRNYEQAIQYEEESRKRVNDLKEEVRSLESKLENAEKVFKQQGADETLRNLLGGFKLSDEVWFVKNHYKRETCQTCLGDKELIVEIKGEELNVQCPKCKGYGTTSNMIQTVEKGTVKEIDMHTWADGRQFEVKMYIEPTSYPANNSVESRLGGFFKTKEECEASMKKLA